MEFCFTPEQEALRQEVRSFLEQQINTGTFTPKIDGWIYGWSPELSRNMARRGWIGYTWPAEYGGQGKSYLDRLVLTEECLRYGACAGHHIFGDRQIGPSIMAFGSDEQRKQFLPRILTAEISFSIGMSEPEAGSDLASLKTRAVETDDGFIVNGQKVWTSNAHRADYLYLVARTNPDAPKHKGISEFIVDLKSPGITISPIDEITGHAVFCEIFFDNVKLPKAALIGGKDHGWYQIAQQLDYERSGLERIMSNYLLFYGIKQYVNDSETLRNDQFVIHRIADLEIEFETGKLLVYRVAWLLSQGKVLNTESAMAKHFGTTFEQKLSETAIQILGPLGQIMGADSPLKGMAPENYMGSLGNTIRGGTTEILKNIIAQRGLGLPAK